MPATQETKTFMSLRLPENVEQKLSELYEMCKAHPSYLPPVEVARFLGADAAGLRSSIDDGKCPFGIAWQKDLHGNRAFKIPTATFFLWYTQGVGYRG